jgi:hypothetical protein
VLENNKFIGKAKRHNIIFKILIFCPERSLPFTTSFYPSQIINSSEIAFCINVGLTKLIKKLKNKRQWISIFIVILLMP